MKTIAAFAFLCTFAAQAQDQVRILVGFPPGGSADLIARLVADRAREGLGGAVIVENRPGAGGQIAAEQLKGAPPDGRILMAAPVAVTVIAPLTHKKLRYEPSKDFAPVSLAVNFQLAFSAGPGSPATSLAEYIAWVKANPKQATFGSPAAGSLPHFFGLLVGRAAGVEMLHVAYKGGAPLLNDLLGGQVPAAVDVLSEAARHHDAGKLRILASSGTKRSIATPNVPTFTELGHPQIQGDGWFAFHAPAGTPRAVVDRQSAAIAAAIRAPDVSERLVKMGFEPVGSTPDELAKRMTEDTLRWGPVVKASGFTADQ
jgi:tripartite-type tricarboxylate transporter receptor subunit TctC